jgi:hypothetical protein
MSYNLFRVFLLFVMTVCFTGWADQSAGGPNDAIFAPADTQTEVYLVEFQNDLERARCEAHGSLVPAGGDRYLLELPAGATRHLMLPENAVYLGYAPVDTYPRPVTETETFSFTRNSQIQDLVNEISQSQLMADLATLTAFQTRWSYAPECRQAATWLGNEYESLGYAVTYHEHDRNMAPNVIAEKPGVRYPDEIVIVCGHFDSISLQPSEFAPGADDNGTGTAATLNAARVMADMYFDRTVRFIAFSGEEQGLRGSQAYAQRSALQGDNIIAVINLDMIGYVHEEPGDIEVIGNPASEPLVDLFIDCSASYTSLETNKIINSSIIWSDHSPFWSYGYLAMLGIEDYPIRYPDYHSIHDTIDKITPEFMFETTKAATATVASLANPMMDIVYIYNWFIDDSGGDGDGFLDPNETAELIVEIINNSDQPSGPIQLNLICLSGSQHVIVLNSSVQLPEIEPGGKTDNRHDPFLIQVRPNVPEFTQLTCLTGMKCDAPHSSGLLFHEIITSYSYQDSIMLFDMDTDPDWTADRDGWEWGIPAGEGGTEYGYPDPSGGYTGDHVLGTYLGGDYPPGIHTTITSPVLDFTEIRYSELHFERWLNVEGPEFDQAQIWVSNGDGQFLVWENPVEITDNMWQSIAYDIAPYADGRDDVRISFALLTDKKWEYSGWNLDDIRIAGLAAGPPLPTPTPVIPDDTIGVLLAMPDTDLETGDSFALSLQYWNLTGDHYCDTPLFILFEIENTIWFWPDWSAEMVYGTRYLPAAFVSDPEILLQFTWPEMDGDASNLRFWAAFTDGDFKEILGLYDMIEWGYH